jgi:hypothetical protein
MFKTVIIGEASTPEESAGFLRHEIERWSDVMKRASIKVSQ